MKQILTIIGIFYLSVFFNPPAFAGDCDDKCRATVADSVDAELMKLDKSDQAIIARVKPILDTADINKLGELKDKLERDPLWRIKNKRQRALWYEIVYIALNYASATDCFARGFWFMLYTGKWGEKTKDERIARYDRAQYYLAARHGNSAYECTKQ